MEVVKTGTAAPVPLATGQASPSSLVIDATGNLYWANAGDGTATGGSIEELATDGTMTQIATGAPYTLAVDTSYLYWTDAAAGTVSRWPLSGSGSASVIATGEAQPLGLVVTATCLYFADDAGAVVGSGSLRGHDLD